MISDTCRLPSAVCRIGSVALLLGLAACSKTPSSNEPPPPSESSALPASVIEHIREGGHEVATSAVSRQGTQGGEAKASDSMIISTTMNDIRARLKDPDSADFSNMDVSRRGSTVVVCGFVNANNSFGGKTGRERFIVSGLAATLESDVEAGGFQPVWDAFC